MGTLKIKVAGVWYSIPRGPRGLKGDTGDAGPANSLAIGTVTTGAAGSSASASITGTPPTQTLDLTIPRGDVGAAGVGNPAGAIVMYAGAVAPTGYLLCQGQAVSRTTYADLFTAIGTAYGTGDGSTTFNLPDLRVRLPIGAGTGKALGASDGVAEASRNANHSHSHGHSASASTSTASANVSGSASSDPGHTHGGLTGDAGSHSHGGATGTPSGSANAQNGTGQVVTGSNHTHSISSDGTHQHTISAVNSGGHSHTISVSDSGHSHTASASVGSGGSADHPYVVVNYIIKT